MIFNILFISMSIAAIFTFKKHYIFFAMLIVASVLALPVSIAQIFNQPFNGMMLLSYVSKFIYVLIVPIALLYEKRRKI